MFRMTLICDEPGSVLVDGNRKSFPVKNPKPPPPTSTGTDTDGDTGKRKTPLAIVTLQSRNVRVWVERPANGRVSPKTHLLHYLKSTAFSAMRTTMKILPFKHLRVSEAYIEATSGANYRVAVRIAPHWQNLGIQLIIDDVERGNYICFNQLRTFEARITGRQSELKAMRGFCFTVQRIEDTGGTYYFDEKANQSSGYISGNVVNGDIPPIRFTVGPGSVRTIRVNVYRVGKVAQGGSRPDEACGDWAPCEVVDDIDTMKIPAEVESITTLGGAFTRCVAAKPLYAEFLDRYPFETFILKYKPPENTAKENPRVVKRTGLNKLVHNFQSCFRPEPSERVYQPPKGYKGKLIKGEKITVVA
ncbi:hypothetical protein Dda_7669 [Drechslerella dactyloides]|uniref:Uncharacterized protein n=1 Tax=Drechslerella dactyloides TaxID=74499 RepID=A0AAD6IUH4_DREDA|nr:hypothetical protein Dda_7669 [Drechslerella dactyloides]